jgi:hypothetical protein
MTDGTPISYLVLAKGTPVLTAAGRPFGTVEHVLQIPSEDLFDGIVVATDHGIRFVDRDQITSITDRAVTCALDDEQVAALPEPDGTPTYTVDAAADTGRDLHDVFGRLFGRGRWKPDKPDDAG